MHATGIREDAGAEHPVAQGPDGAAQVVATEVQLAPGESRQVVVTFLMPGRHGRMRVEPSARYPGISWHYGSRAWQDSEAHTANY